MTDRAVRKEEETRLDDITEVAIKRAVYSGCGCMTPGECRYCAANADDLRQRIRTLIEEARQELVSRARAGGLL